ncbi:MAG: aldo/keto reductase [Phycisphaerales bacterium]|nr:aldo/keto reductase [Phycisphaerales bacterium]
MLTRPLGRTGIHVSVLGLGTVKLGRAEGVKYPSAFQIPSDEQAADLIRTALDLGITLFDTAPAYGESEARLGGLLAGVRDRVVLCTKVGESFAGGLSTFDFSPPAITASIDRSLKRLRTDRIDIVLLHSDGRVELDAPAMDAAIGELLRLKTAGKIWAIGASTKTPPGALRLIGRCDCLMLTLNPGYLGDRPVIAEAARAGTGVLIKKALASGHAAVKEASPGEDPVRAALSLALCTPGVSSVVVGTIAPEHLAANARAARAVLERPA